MQNVAARVGRALSNTVTAAVAGGSGATTAECRARNAQPSSTPSFLDFEIISRDQDAASSSSSSSSSSPSPTPAVPLADQVSPEETSQAIEIVLQGLPAAAVARALAGDVSPEEAVVRSGSASPASSAGGAAAHMRDAEESLAALAAADQQQQMHQLQSPHAQQCLRTTLTHLLSDRGVRAACERALRQSADFAQLLLRLDREASSGVGGGAESASALADLLPIAARAALAAGGGGGGGLPPPPPRVAAGGEIDGGDDGGRDGRGDGNGDGGENNNPLAAAVAEAVSEALSALSSAKEALAGLGAAAAASMLEAGVHVLGWTRHLARLARGEEEAGPWTTAGGGRARARARSFRARLRPRSFRPADLDGWVKLVTAVAMAVVAVIFVRRRGGLAAPRGGGV